MTKEIVFFTNEKLANDSKKLRKGIFRVLHHDKLKDGRIKITFVNGSDDYDNNIQNTNSRINFAREKVLKEKIKLGTAKNVEIMEYMVLRDKLNF